MRSLFSVIVALCLAAGAASAAAYDDFTRGIWANANNQPDIAIDAFSAAIGAGDLSPGLLPAAYRGRASAYLTKRQCALALADLEAGLNLKPDDAILRLMHAFASACLDKIDLAIADYTSLLAARPDGETYRLRGALFWRKDDFTAAAADFAAAAALRPRDAYSILWLEMSRLRAGAFDPARARRDIAPFDQDDWPGALLALYAGDAKPDDIAAAATRGRPDRIAGQRCEADFYLGEWWLARAEAVAAKPLLQRAADECSPDFVEYGQARVELGRMK